MENSKPCSKCGIVKPLSEFGKNKRYKDGYTYQCKACINSARRERYKNDPEFRKKKAEWRPRYRAEHPEEFRAKAKKSEDKYRANHPDRVRARANRWNNNNKDKLKGYREKYSEKPKKPIPEMVVCGKCGLEKPPTEYWHNKYTPDGLAHWCKDCQNEYLREMYAINDAFREKRKAKSERWAKANPDKVRAYGRKASRRYHKAHPEKGLAYSRKYRSTHPFFNATNHNRRRARLLEIPGSYTAEEFIALCSQYDNLCVCCKKALPLTADHVVPVTVKGATNFISNIQPLCQSCNSKKHQESIDFRPYFFDY